METNYTPGQILYIQSTENYFYISVIRSMQQHPVVNDVNRYEINTYCDLCVDVYGGEMYPSTLTFARDNGSTFDLDIEFDEIRPAHNFEKKLLLDRLVYEFKLHHPKWMHLTDSTYFDIFDWLCWEFNINIESLDPRHPIPIEYTINEIQKYIWDSLCRETGNDHACTDYVEPEMVNKQEFIEKVRNWLEKHTYDDKYWTPDGDDLFLGNLIGDICEYLEE